MSRKRYRVVNCKDDELVCRWGRDRDGEVGLTYCAWGSDARANMHMLHNFLGLKMQVTTDPVQTDFLQELEKRGYDLTTFRFSIRKKLTQKA